MSKLVPATSLFGRFRNLEFMITIKTIATTAATISSTTASVRYYILLLILPLLKLEKFAITPKSALIIFSQFV